MTGWHTGRLVPWDLETTGPDPETARIVTAYVGVIDGAGQEPPVETHWLAAVEDDIPAEATAVHGITTEQARADGLPARRVVAEVIDELARHMQAGIPAVGFNLSYDFTVLDREARRHGVKPLSDRLPAVTPVVDAYVLDKAVDMFRRGKRTLGDVCRHYGVDLDGAHDASADAVAAARVAWRIASRYPHIAEMPLEELHAAQIRWRADQCASFQDYLRRSGKPGAVIDGSWPLIPFTEPEAAS